MTFQLSTSGKCCAEAVQVNVKIKKKKEEKRKEEGKNNPLEKFSEKNKVTFSDRTRQNGFKLKEGKI